MYTLHDTFDPPLMEAFDVTHIPRVQSAIEALGMGRYGAIFFYRVANFNALGIIEDSCLG